MPINEYVLPLDKTKLNANKTHGKYMALKRVPNQKLTIASLFSWHQMYSTDRIIGSINSYKGNCGTFKNVVEIGTEKNLRIRHKPED